MSRTKKAARRGKTKHPTSERSPTSMINRIKHRNELMRNSDRKVNDLTISDATNLPNFSIQPSATTTVGSTPELSLSGIEVNLSVGFLGYDDSFPVGEITVDSSWFESKETLHRRILSWSLRTFVRFGVSNYCQVYGWEVQYPSGYTSLQGRVEPEEFAIINDVQAFKTWLSQFPGQGAWIRSMTVRFVPGDGTKFDPSFRTKKESAAERSLTQSLDDVEEAFENMTMSDLAEVKSRATLAANANPPRKAPSKQVRAMLKGRARAGLLSSRERARLARDSTPSSTPFLAPRTPTLRALSLPEIDLRGSFLAMNKPSDTNIGKAEDTEMDDVS